MYSGNFITFALHSVSDFGQTHMECILERCSSGLRGTPGKRVYDKIVSRVRIPISPHQVAGRISDWLFVSSHLKAGFHSELDIKAIMYYVHWLPGARATPARGIGKKLAQQG